MGSFLLKLRLIVWKNFIIRKRHKILTIFEIVMPILLFIILPIVQMSIDLNLSYNNETTYYSERELNTTDKIDLFYAPNTSDVNEIMMKAKSSTRTNIFGL